MTEVCVRFGSLAECQDPTEDCRSPTACAEKRRQLQERQHCPICNSFNGHSFGCATLNLKRDVIEGEVIHEPKRISDR